MPPAQDLLGRDLRVVLGPPGVGAHDAAPLDARLAPRPAQRSRAPRGILRATDEGAAAALQGFAPEPPGAAEVTDLAVIAGRENLAQALILRLLTPKGALADLGHAEYGSRLGDLIGRNKTDALRGLCRAYILEAVRMEPRVEPKPLAIRFDPLQETASDFVVEIVVQPVSGGDAVTLGVEVGLS
jgi:phage baseplate assembly protein W